MGLGHSVAHVGYAEPHGLQPFIIGISKLTEQ